MTNRSLPAYQSLVAEFVTEHNLDASVETRLLDLLSELGEVAKEALKTSQYGKLEGMQTEEWAAELGDVFFSLVCLANTTGVNLEETLEDTLTKYRQRLESAGDAGSGH
jgi:NTP pyrophosphatase (non-canonical NTP hydrolase)